MVAWEWGFSSLTLGGAPSFIVFGVGTVLYTVESWASLASTHYLPVAPAQLWWRSVCMPRLGAESAPGENQGCEHGARVCMHCLRTLPPWCCRHWGCVIVVGGSPVPCKILSSMPGFHPLEPGVSLPPVLTTPGISGCHPMSPSGAQSLLVEN